jgi:hypothetical protein
LAKFLQKLLIGVPNMPKISITGGLLGGGQLGLGSVDLGQLMILIRAYFGNPNLQPEYVNWCSFFSGILELHGCISAVIMYFWCV